VEFEENYMGTTRYSEAQKEKILKTASKLFIDKGYKGTTTREIADVARINKGLLHYYYNRKEDIVSDIYKAFVEGLIGFVENRYGHELKGLDFFALLNMLFFKVATSERQYIEILLDVLSNTKLTKYKIDRSMECCLDVLLENGEQEKRSQLLIAITISVGAESQLMLAIEDGSVDMTYRELAITVLHVCLVMMEIDEAETEAIIGRALQKADTIDARAILDYIGQRCAWAGLPQAM
jgi:AcrR family transcriptional regulator